MSSVNPLAGSAPLPQATAPAATGAQAQLPMNALVSPYDGTVPTTLGTASPYVGSQVPTLTGLGAGADGSGRQLNATNQTAYAPNGNVNQNVVNENQYTNKYYNIIVPGSGLGSALGGVGGLFGGWNTPGNSFIDPQTGVLYVQKDTGITGWFKRLFRGY